MSIAKRAYLDALQSTKNMGVAAVAIRALHTQGLAQEIVDNLSLAPEEYIPTARDGGVPRDLAAAVADLMLEDAKARREALVELSDAIRSLPGHEYHGVVCDIQWRIADLSRILPTKEN